MLAMAHEGHLGIVKLKQRCCDLVWWPGIDKDIEALVKECPACLVSGKTGRLPPPPLQPLAWPSKPWEHLQLDICGEIHGAPHYQRFLVVVYDLHSKWPELTTTGSVTSQVIVEFLESLFSRWGLPQTITTDNGPQFISAEFTSYLKDRGIRHIRTALYHPQANGGVERFHQSLKNGLRAHQAQGCSFKQAICLTLLHYRATQHSTTEVSPASLMLGRELHLPLDRLRPTAGQNTLPPVEASVTRRQKQMKQWFDKKKRVKIPDIAVADWVRARRPHRGNKMASFWSTPQQVARRLGPATYLLDDGTRWHASCLKKVPAPPATSTQGSGDIMPPREEQEDSIPQSAAQPEDTPSPLPQPPASTPQFVTPSAVCSPRPLHTRARPDYLKDFVP